MTGGAVGRDVGCSQHNDIEAAEETVMRVGHADGFAESTLAILFDVSRLDI